MSHNSTLTPADRRPLAVAKRLITAISAVGLLACCASTSSEQVSTPATTAPAEPATTTTNPNETATCMEPYKAEVHNRILMQIDLLGVGAFEEAREHASTSFRNSVDVAGFQEMIESGFPFLLENWPIAFGRCRITDGTATVEVRVGEEPAITLIYFLIQSDNRWWIDGASPAVDGLADKVESS